MTNFKYEEVLCPDCNGPMVSRKSSYGVFWGCKKFPECKGTRDSSGKSKRDRAIEKGEEVEQEEEKDFTKNYDGEKFSFRKKLR